ncbi:hypothetical protein [Motilibacter deserti]|uniref:Uncharacterized protein n=1 Tax=Motilibacter deserti TaxID=2714956 RepID=A0ABX0GYY4_9ACTN|nr:hypothetical protein [Motilibacter deserti]NHC16211.1 hypothetical protein [Motilibacter deserti]
MGAQPVSPALAPGDYTFVTLSPAVPPTGGPTPDTAADVLFALALLVMAFCALAFAWWLAFARRNRCGF